VSSFFRVGVVKRKFKNLEEEKIGRPWENKSPLAFLFKKKKKKKKKKIPIFTPTFFSFSPGGRTVFFFHGRLRLVITQGKYGREK
jgi:hypothetical protein